MGDSWQYIWNTSQFSSVRIYQHLSGFQPVPPYLNWLWACTCQRRHKVFFWLLLKDRLNTRNLLRRKNCPLEDYTCILCDQGREETSQHLFWNCPFAQQCWKLICPHHSPLTSTSQAVLHLKAKINQSFSMEIIVLTTWAIWITRNNYIFKQQNPTIAAWRYQFCKEFALLNFRTRPHLKLLLKTWLDNLG